VGASQDEAVNTTWACAGSPARPSTALVAASMNVEAGRMVWAF
jgi:hypothetical protein